MTKRKRAPKKTTPSKQRATIRQGISFSDRPREERMWRSLQGLEGVMDQWQLLEPLATHRHLVRTQHHKNLQALAIVDPEAAFRAAQRLPDANEPPAWNERLGPIWQQGREWCAAGTTALKDGGADVIDNVVNSGQRRKAVELGVKLEEALRFLCRVETDVITPNALLECHIETMKDFGKWFSNFLNELRSAWQLKPARILTAEPVSSSKTKSVMTAPSSTSSVSPAWDSLEGFKNQLSDVLLPASWFDRVTKGDLYPRKLLAARAAGNLPKAKKQGRLWRYCPIDVVNIYSHTRPLITRGVVEWLRQPENQAKAGESERNRAKAGENNRDFVTR